MRFVRSLSKLIFEPLLPDHLLYLSFNANTEFVVEQGSPPTAVLLMRC